MNAVRNRFQFPALFWAFFMIVVYLYGCGNQEEPPLYKFTRFAMDTVVEYTLVAPSDSVARRSMQEAQQEINRIDRLLWEENPSSEIYKLNHAGQPIKLTAEVAQFLQRANMYYHLSGGAFDMTIKPVLDLYPFDTQNPVPPSASEISKKLQLVGMDKFNLDSLPVVRKKYGEVAVAVGGVAKGYAVDRAVRILKKNGIRNGIVNAGGDLYCLGTKNGKPWAVGIQHPRKPDAIVQVIYLSDMAAATSGDYQRYFMYDGHRFHHILNPQTGRPAGKSRSTTVIAPTTEAADALATALFIMGADVGIPLIDELPDVEGMVIDSSGNMYQSKNFQKFTEPDR